VGNVRGCDEMSEVKRPFTHILNTQQSENCCNKNFILRKEAGTPWCSTLVSSTQRKMIVNNRFWVS